MAELTLNEKRLLAALKLLGSNNPEYISRIAESMGATPEAVVQWAHLAMDNGLVKLERIVEKSYVYTDEGSAYRAAGLPETQLLSAIGEKGTTLAELQKHPAFKIGFGQLRKKGLVTVRGTEITKNTGASTDDDEEAFADPEGFGAEAKEFIKRKLLTETESVQYTVALTPAGYGIARGDLDLREEIGTLTRDQILSGSWKTASLRKYDIHKLPKTAYPGKTHPYQRLIDEMRQILLEMGFIEMHGGIVQSAFWNFDALFQPQDHPAREMQDTFYLKEEAPLPAGWERLRDMHEHGGETSSTGWGGKWNPEKAKQCVLRTHTTSLSIQYLVNHPKPPVKSFCIGRVYRREAIDPTHTPEFEQLEGIVMDKGVTFRHLLGFLKEFYQRMGFEDVRFRPGFFPYTEPSVEPEIWVDGLGWVEMGGAGVFRQEVTAPWGVTCPVLAWGLGVSRVAMFRLELKDLRQLYQSDLEWIRTNPVHAPAKVGRKA